MTVPVGFFVFLLVDIVYKDRMTEVVGGFLGSPSRCGCVAATNVIKRGFGPVFSSVYHNSTKFRCDNGAENATDRSLDDNQDGR